MSGPQALIRINNKKIRNYQKRMKKVTTFINYYPMKKKEESINHGHILLNGQKNNLNYLKEILIMLWRVIEKDCQVMHL